ncbi:hypothetical protein D3C80_1315130 [compost metagenome]
MAILVTLISQWYPDKCIMSDMQKSYLRYILLSRNDDGTNERTSYSSVRPQSFGLHVRLSSVRNPPDIHPLLSLVNLVTR